MRSRACKSAEAKQRRKLSRLAPAPPAAALCSAPCLASRTSLHLLRLLTLARSLARSPPSPASPPWPASPPRSLPVSPRSLRRSDPSAHLFRANTPTAAWPVPACACLLRGSQPAEGALGAGAAGDERGFAARDRTGCRPPGLSTAPRSPPQRRRGQHCALDVPAVVECCWLHCHRCAASCASCKRASTGCGWCASAAAVTLRARSSLQPTSAAAECLP